MITRIIYMVSLCVFAFDSRNENHESRSAAFFVTKVNVLGFLRLLFLICLGGFERFSNKKLLGCRSITNWVK